MKKTLDTNLGGRIFHIDEDAYSLLETYLRNVGSELADSQARCAFLSKLETHIADLASEYSGEHMVLDMEATQQILQQAAQFPIPDRPLSRTKERSTLSQRSSSQTKFAAIGQHGEAKPVHRYYRDMERSLLCGVLSGLSAFVGWHLITLRIIVFLLFVILALWGVGWLLLFAYLSFWMICPPIVTASDRLRLYGKPITMDNIARTVAEEAERMGHKPHTAGSKLGCILKSLLVGASILAIIFMTLSLTSALLGFFDTLFRYVPGGYTLTHLPEGLALSANISVLIVLIIPLLVLLVKRDKGSDTSLANRWIKWIVIGVWFAAIGILVVTFILLVHRLGLGVLPFFHRFIG